MDAIDPLLLSAVACGCFHCLQFDQVRHAGNAFTLPRACGGHQRAGGYCQHTVKLSVGHQLHDMGAQHAADAAAAGASGVNILRLPVKYHHAAVVVSVSEIDALTREKLAEQVAPHKS